MTRIILKSRGALMPLLAFVAILSGCATVPSEQQFGQTASATKISSVRQQPELHQNVEVVWGGTVIGISNRAEDTWVEIIDRPLQRGGIPILKEQSAGRFIAIIPGFLDPLDYGNGRSITITGTVNGSETRKIEEADYDYPIVAVVEHQLWTEAQARSTERRYDSRIHNPYFAGYYGYPFLSRFGFGLHGYHRFGGYGYGYGLHRGRHRGK